jgi:hypothetical protein
LPINIEIGDRIPLCRRTVWRHCDPSRRFTGPRLVGNLLESSIEAFAGLFARCGPCPGDWRGARREREDGMIESARGGTGSHKHGVNGRAPKSPRFKFLTQLELRDQEKATKKRP